MGQNGDFNARYSKIFLFRWKKMPPISLREFELVIKMPEKTASFPLPPMKFSVQCPADYPYWAQLPSTKWQWLKSNEDWPLQNASMLHFSVEFSAGKNHIIFNPTNVVVPSVNCEKIQSRIALLSQAPPFLVNFPRKYWICLKELFTIIPSSSQNSKPLIEQRAPLTKKSRKSFYGGPRIRDKRRDERGFRKPDFQTNYWGE